MYNRFPNSFPEEKSTKIIKWTVGIFLVGGIFLIGCVFFNMINPKDKAVVIEKVHSVNSVKADYKVKFSKSKNVSVKTLNSDSYKQGDTILTNE